MVDRLVANHSMEKSNVILKRVSQLILIYLIFLSIASFGILRFGHGMGDGLYNIIIWVATLVFVLINWKIRNRDSSDRWGQVIMWGLFSIMITYKATLGRGPEYPWNGDFFIF